MKLKRIGDALVLLIDPEVAAQAGMAEDSVVQLSVRDGELRVQPLEGNPDEQGGPHLPPSQDG